MKIAKGVIKVMTADQVPEAAAFAWSVYQDETKRTTPPYRSLGDVAKGFSTFTGRESEYLLGYYEDNQLLGVMTVTIELENKYCNIYGPYIEKAENYAEISELFMAFVDAHGKDCHCYVGTTKPNVNSQRYFEAKGFICTDDTVQTRLYPCDIKEVVGPYNVQTLSEEDYDLYRLFHTKHFSDYTWTAERIYETMERWDVSIVKIEGEIVGNTFTCAGEVFGGMVLPQYEHTELMAQLYYENSAAHFKRGFKEIVWFMPEGYQLEAAKRVGYEPYDTYLCYEHNSL